MNRCSVDGWNGITSTNLKASTNGDLHGLQKYKDLTTPNPKFYTNPNSVWSPNSGRGACQPWWAMQSWRGAAVPCRGGVGLARTNITVPLGSPSSGVVVEGPACLVVAVVVLRGSESM